jgi:hypothetical protein
MVKHFSAAQAIWNNRIRLSEALPEIRTVRSTLQDAIGGPRDFVHQQWLQVVSAVYEFKPDLIIELGRGYGNSTCALSVAAKMLRPAPCRILSLCLASSFVEISRPFLETHLEEKSLFEPLTALQCDIQAYDFARDVEKAQRIFIFWDAHGYDLAMALLAKLFPLLQGKPHLALVHDMADLKYMDQHLRRYGTEEAWLKAGSSAPKYVLGDVGSQFDEGVALVDFLGRNQIPFRSAESSYFSELSQEQLAELSELFGADFSRYGFWYCFSLNDAEGAPISFPPSPPPPTQAAPPSEAVANSARPKRSFFRFLR